MNIGFDIDGVIFPIEDYQIERGKLFFKNKLINSDGYGIKEVFNCTAKQEVMFWLINSIDYNTKVKATPGIKSLIDDLRDKGNKVYIVSSRAMADKNTVFGACMRKLVLNALKRNGIQVDGIHFTSTKESGISKANIVSDYNIHIMVDDCVENLNALKTVTRAICYTTRCNRPYNDEMVSRVNNVDKLRIVIENIISEYYSSFPQKLDFNNISILNDEQKKIYFSGLKAMYSGLIDRYWIEECSRGCIKVKKIFQKVFNFLYRPHIVYPERFPTQGGVILAINHLHSFDPLLVMQNSKMPFRLLAKEELKSDKKYSKLFCKIGSIFVDNSDPISRAKAKEELIKTVLADGVVMMFPEGTRNKTKEELLRFHMGTVSVAQITGAPIYPIAINADYRLFRNTLCAVIGNPFYVTPIDDLVAKNEELRQIILEMKRKIDKKEW